MIYKKILLFIGLLGLLNASAQPPSGYYDDAQGLTGEDMRQALHDIIDDHNSQSYDDIWNHFMETDRKSNDKVWDMYSDVPGGTPPYEYDFIIDQCGSYQQEGDCYNREHSWPKSWFNEGYPMNTDLFHIIPSDGYVNGKRSYHPYGETSEPYWNSQNGSELGSSSFSSMSGTVFEPIDAYKGDLARVYLYMATRYYNEDDNWHSNELVDGSDLTLVGTALLLKWHQQDPVSEKELVRNNAIYDIQGNRNPFVDHPEFAQDVWGNVNTPPYFFNTITDTTIEEGHTADFYVEFGDNEPEAVSISYNCLFCAADFITVTDSTNNIAKLHIAPEAGDAGTYTIAVIADDGTNQTVDFAFQLTIAEGNAITDLSQFLAIQPNPANRNFQITTRHYLKSSFTAEVYNIGGQLIDAFNINQNAHLSFGSDYKKGTYLLRLTNQTHTFTKKLVKQ